MEQLPTFHRLGASEGPSRTRCLIEIRATGHELSNYLRPNDLASIYPAANLSSLGDT